MRLKSLRMLAVVGLVGLFSWLVPASLAWATDPLTVNPPTGQPGDRCRCLTITVSVSNPAITRAQITNVSFDPADGITIIDSDWQRQAKVEGGKFVFEVCIKISKDASPGERTVLVTYTGYEVTRGTQTTVNSFPDQRARGRFEVGGARKVENVGCGVVEPPGAPKPDPKPDPPGPPPPCGCWLVWALARLSYQPDPFQSPGVYIELELRFVGEGSITIEAEPSDRLLIIKKPDGTEMRALPLPGATASPRVKRVIPCAQGEASVRLSVLLLGLIPPDNPEANLIRSFLDQLPKGWQVAPGQYSANVLVGAFFKITVEDFCQPPNIATFTIPAGFIIGPFRLIREASGQLRLVVDGELQIQLLPPKRAALAASRSLARRLKVGVMA